MTRRVALVSCEVEAGDCFASSRPVLAEGEETRWVKLELARVLAEPTGRRLGSIRQLRWEDVDFEHNTIRWRAEFDKKGKEWVVPMPASLAEELKQFRRRLGAISGWIFGGERKPDQPMDRHLFDRWLHVAEKKAELPKLTGGLWHRTGASGRRSESTTR